MNGSSPRTAVRRGEARRGRPTVYLEMQILGDESRRRVFTLNPREVIIFQKRIFAPV